MELLVEEYREAIRISYAMGIAFFFYMMLNAAVNVRSNKGNGSFSYFTMSCGVFLYSLFGFIQTFPQLTEYAMFILKAQLIVALIAYFSYLCTIEKVLEVSNFFESS